MQVHRLIAAGLLALGCLVTPSMVLAWDDAKADDSKPAVAAEEAKPADAPAAETPAAEASSEAPAKEPAKEEHGTDEKPADAPAKTAPAAADHKEGEHKEGDHKAGDHAAADHAAEGHAADGHGHGDEHDLSHSNATASLEKPDEFRFELAVGTFLVFCVLLAILTKFAWGPIVSGLDKREQGIADMIENARIANEQAAAKLREHEARLSAAAEETRALLTQARVDAEAAREKIVGEAQAAAARERDRAVADIATAKSVALKEIAEKSVETALALAGNIVRREIKPEDHETLITEALNKFPTLN